MAFTLPFSQIGIDALPEVGGKNASLGEMVRELAPRGVRVPNGFAVTASAFRQTLDEAEAWPRLRDALDGLDADNVDDLARRARLARDIVYGAALPPPVAEAVADSYRALVKEYGEGLAVAVRSSATAEDLPTASFAGQHESYLNIAGEARLLDAVRRCFASLYTDRAIAYRVRNGFDHFKVCLSVGVMKMVRSDLACSGVAFSLDTESGFRDVVFINSAYGLGETVVQGTVDPDEFYVFKPTLAQGFDTVLRRRLGRKEIRMLCAHGGQEGTRVAQTAQADQRRFSLSDEEAVSLARATVEIERHYSERAGHAVPMDVEWGKDGTDGELYIVQARPETVASRKSTHTLDEYRLLEPARALASGRAVGSKVATGRARVVRAAAELGQFRQGDVLVADATNPDWGTVMKQAAAIVTNRGGRTCHAAIVAREMGVPAVVGCGSATEAIRDGDQVTVSCAEGDQGHVYAGKVPFTVTSTDLSALELPQTPVMLNIGNPEQAFQASFLPCAGVGLARMEFIVADTIRVHPMAMAHPDRLDDPALQHEIERIAHGHATPADYFVRQLSEGVATIAAAFYPRPVIVRMSDFKTNEYASLIGGRQFEPQEANPMLGFRGAARYAHPRYADGFALECAAMRRVRDEMGLVNLKLMIPFCRKVDEAQRVLDAMALHGLARGRNGLEVYLMCEVPNNVFQVDAFAELFDGFSIGSNDLTQLVLGVDRDSEVVAFDFDERDEGVKRAVRMAIEGAHRHGRHIGVCGQAPSDYPDFAQFLAGCGIDSISLNPDSILKTLPALVEAERQLGPGRH